MLASKFDAVSLFTISEYTEDMCIMKIDTNGIYEWDQTFGGENFDSATAVIQTADGKFLAAGYSEDNEDGAIDVVLIKTDATGSLEWNKKYRSYEDCRITGLLQISDGFLLSRSDFRLIKITTSGDEVWIKHME